MMKRDIVSTNYSGYLTVYIQGDLFDRAGKCLFLTVQDVGSTHERVASFVDSKEMEEVRAKSVWIHVLLPGQDDNDEELPEEYVFPTLDQLAHDLLFVLNKYRLGMVIGFGLGAGANILTRFALSYPNRLLALVLIDCTSHAAPVDERVKYQVTNFLDGGLKLAEKMIHSYYTNEHKKAPGFERAEYKRAMNAKSDKYMNRLNQLRYAEAYLKRTDITPAIGKYLKMECLIAVGQYYPNLEWTKKMTDQMDKRSATLILVDDVIDVISQARKKLTRALILLGKGCGVLLNVPMIGLEREYKLLKSRANKVPNIEQNSSCFCYYTADCNCDCDKNCDENPCNEWTVPVNGLERALYIEAEKKLSESLFSPD